MILIQTVNLSDSDTPESRRRALSDSDSDTSDVPPELPPRTPNRTVSTVAGGTVTTMSNGEQRVLRTVSVASTDAAVPLTSLANDQWNSGTSGLPHLLIFFYFIQFCDYF